MRQLFIQVPRGHGRTVANEARAAGAVNVVRLEGRGDGRKHDDDPQSDREAPAGPERKGAGTTGPPGERPLEVVLAHVSNGSVEPLLARLEDVPDLRLSFFPNGVLALQPPPSEAPRQVKDVEERSPVEVFLAGVQSVGSWKGFTGYAVATGAVVWVGLLTNTVYLLTAAMLIAPFAGPAMNAALATASGDARLLGQSLLRYVGALAVTVAVAAGLSWGFGQEVATAQMLARSQVSAVAVLLPLVAGAAGALNLMQSDRDSLVSGAAVGILVAASLAPPTGLVGMAASIGRWDLAASGAFVLALQLAGINFTGALVFRLYGLSGRGARYEAGNRWLFPAGLAVTGAALAALLFVQFSESPRLERSSLAQRAAGQVQQVVKEHPGVSPVEVNVRFTRASVPGQHTLLVEVYVQRRGSRPAPALRTALTRRVQQHLRQRWPNVTPLVSVTVLNAPSAKRLEDERARSPSGQRLFSPDALTFLRSPAASACSGAAWPPCGCAPSWA